MGELTKEQVEKINGLTKQTRDALLGICMFCETPIMDTSVKNDMANFSIIFQRLFVHMDDKHITKDIRGFFCCRDCSLSQFKLNIVKQISEIHVNLTQLNHDFASKLKEFALKEQAKKNLEEEMKRLEESKNEEII